MSESDREALLARRRREGVPEQAGFNSGGGSRIVLQMNGMVAEIGVQQTLEAFLTELCKQVEKLAGAK